MNDQIWFKTLKKLTQFKATRWIKEGNNCRHGKEAHKNRIHCNEIRISVMAVKELLIVTI